MIVVLSTPYVHNPYMKGQFVEVIYYNTRPNYRNRQGALGDAINTHPLALQQLMPALIHIYIGRHEYLFLFRFFLL
jgi:ubiquitin conjugation factor E4 B